MNEEAISQKKKSQPHNTCSNGFSRPSFTSRIPCHTKNGPRANCSIISQMGGMSLKGQAFGLDAVLSYGSFAIRKTSPCPALVMTMRVMCLADLGGRF